jgi:proteasome lid subunit RPN8/RPN11
MKHAEDGRILIGGLGDVFELIEQEIRSFKHEVIKLISLDPQNRLINCETISDGAVDITLLRPREVFANAFKNSATSIILVHNHPSGSQEPSESDIEVTKKLVRIGKMIGVWIQDHVIIGSEGYTSMRANGIISNKLSIGKLKTTSNRVRKTMGALINSEVKEDIRSFFKDPRHWAYQYGTPTPGCNPNSPYHRKQIEVLFEYKYFHWVTNRVIDSLIDEGFLRLEKKDIAHFVYRSDIRYIRRKINRRVKIISRYIDPTITKAIGDYAQMLFSFMFRLNGFRIVGENTNEYRGLKWEETEHDLDFIIEKDSIAYGVEVKNTLPYMEEDEFKIKLKMCEFLSLIPLWILRNAPAVQFEQMKPCNGFILKFKTQIYPPGQEPLIRDMWEIMRLPVSIWKKIPEKLENIFLRQHTERIAKQRTISSYPPI